jgi:hypothetical protein
MKMLEKETAFRDFLEVLKGQAAGVCPAMRAGFRAGSHAAAGGSMHPEAQKAKKKDREQSRWANHAIALRPVRALTLVFCGHRLAIFSLLHEAKVTLRDTWRGCARHLESDPRCRELGAMERERLFDEYQARALAVLCSRT